MTSQRCYSVDKNRLPAEKAKFLTANNKLSEDFGDKYFLYRDGWLEAFCIKGKWATRLRRLMALKVLGIDSIVGTSTLEHDSSSISVPLMSDKHRW